MTDWAAILAVIVKVHINWANLGLNIPSFKVGLHYRLEIYRYCNIIMPNIHTELQKCVFNVPSIHTLWDNKFGQLDEALLP